MTVLSFYNPTTLSEDARDIIKNMISEVADLDTLVVFEKTGGYILGTCRREKDESEQDFKFRALEFYNSFSN